MRRLMTREIIDSWSYWKCKVRTYIIDSSRVWRCWWRTLYQTQTLFFVDFCFTSRESFFGLAQFCHWPCWPNYSVTFFSIFLTGFFFFFFSYELNFWAYSVLDITEKGRAPFSNCRTASQPNLNGIFSRRWRSLRCVPAFSELIHLNSYNLLIMLIVNTWMRFCTLLQSNKEKYSFFRNFFAWI
jgi:hypothetical protein